MQLAAPASTHYNYNFFFFVAFPARPRRTFIGPRPFTHNIVKLHTAVTDGRTDDASGQWWPLVTIYAFQQTGWAKGARKVAQLEQQQS